MSNTPQKPASNTRVISEELGERLVVGEITPAEFLGLSQEMLYEIAKRGHEMLKTGKLQDALDIFKGLVAASPYDSVFHCNLASTYAHLEKFDEAKDEYTRALELNIGNVDALVGRSELFLREGNVPKALEDIQAALKYDPEAKRENTKRARATLTILKEAAPKK
ncbi:tetratricopeptide repeat protein [Archangium lansingense]|uniref:Tetratricopeptide repeat protein n=1 Tax=Archangium lansingense TaxID=2995310 RepID=A0ABT4A5K9_9BACT|nr:tetratricopeptide repeat protein [Archangium lansinium]MCY1076252.1 tetratricopeptide repeat protein [Archangium lansinium]